MTKRTMFLVLAALALVGAACGGGAEAETTTTSSPLATTSATTEPTTTTTEPTTTTEATTTSAATSEALESLRASLSRTGEADSGRLEGSFEIIGIEGFPGRSFVLPFSGAFDNGNRNFSFVMDMSSLAGQMGDEIPEGFEDLLGDMEVRQIGETTYIKFPLFNMFFGAQTEWVSAPSDEAASATGDFASATPSNPSDFLREFEKADGTVEEIGRETVRGVETTRYRVVFDMETLLEQATPEQRAEIEAQGPLPLDELPMDIWTSDDGLVYRYQIDIDGSAVETAPGEGFESMVMTFEMYDYGEPIVIEAPPADEVTDIESLEGAFGGGFSG